MNKSKMTPTQKAKELADKFGSKELAIMCVDELIKVLWADYKSVLRYEEVKQEIEKL